MSDFSPPPPASPIAKFGTSVVGPEFEWDGIDGDGTVRSVKARAVSSISFDDTLRYTTGRHAQLVQTARSAKSMRDELAEMDPISDEYQAKFEELIQRRMEHERAAWVAAVDTMLILVAERFRDELRPLLINGDPKQVTALREWLEQEVIATAQADAAVTTNVDPTSGPSPENSSPSPASGDDSGSTEQTSTG